MNRGHFRAVRVSVLAIALAGALAAFAARVDARLLAPVDALAQAATVSGTTAGASAENETATAVMRMDPRHGVPTFVSGDAARATLAERGQSASRKSGLDAESTARAHLGDLADLYRISAEEVNALPVHNVQRLDGGGTIVRFRGTVDGIEVFREQANVLLDRNGALAAIGGFVMGAADSRQKAAAVNALDANAAVAVALGDYRFAPSIAAQLQRTDAADGFTSVTLPAGATSGDGASMAGSARVKPVWFRLSGSLLPAYYIEVQMRDAAPAPTTDYYAYVVGANDGRILFRHNQTADVAFSYRVYAEAGGAHLPLPGPNGRNGYPHPTATPDGYQGPYVPANLVTLENAPFSKNDPWLDAGTTRTVGNNVDAYTDITSPTGFNAVADECNLALPANGDMHACTNGANSFDYVYDTNLQPNASRTQVMAAVTNLFYMVNYMHDWYYDAGFDEVSGNAQTSNYGRGGMGADHLLAEVQDFSGSNNANMSTPSDGARPRMQVFLWTSGVTLAKVNAPAAIAGTKQSGTAEFGAQAFDFSNDLVLAVDGANATGPTTTDGCTAFTNAAAVAGRIAVIDRGVCTFAVKVKNAQSAGAAGVVVLNNVAPGTTNMSGDDASITIPSVLVSLADGDAIKGQLAAAATVSMRIARKSAVEREGALDNATIAHEWGHYISNRLVANANGLTAQQARGLGEGFADFHAMLLLVKEADRALPANANFSGTYSDSAYPVSGPDFAPDVLDNSFYFGLRRYPYSRAMTKNPLTFRHITDGVSLPTSAARSPKNGSALNAEVHNAGEVWASMLWECYSNLLNDTARLTFADAQDRMKKYLVAGYKLTPSDPTFVSARDALLAAMQVRDPADRDLCLHGFAKRGLGLGAVAPDNFSEDNKGVVESFMTVKPAGGTKRPVVEYYHAAFDHYFVTDIPDEIAKLDNGTFKGWARTGESFSAYASPPTGSAGVCRFFSTSFSPKSSHFYTPDVNECGIVKASADWEFEAEVFGVLAPGPTGNCPEGSGPVYRLYNNGEGAAPNHRYTTSLATRTQMLGKGWIPEGYGDLGVIMCSPT